LQKAEKLKVSKEKLKEHIKQLQRIVKKLEKKNYYLEQKNKILRGFVGNYEGWYKVLEGFVLIVFIFEKLIVGLYLLGLFDSN